MCKEKRVKHEKIGVESHGSNGRVERAIGTLREELIKTKEGADEERVTER
ncbi:hypothetical protein H312_02268 [Anncaliia algerae PRA339]|uniref:Integrase catalytic domain-containing protein n=1 Tax=Anncaliia algerae PRA339 TaxID=1288291 RepID=A0A059F016_9MICR|nr:hypothetical protein H312_02268 [Anncaliia algerae PRA339]